MDESVADSTNQPPLDLEEAAPRPPTINIHSSTVTLEHEAERATLFYTLDGCDPTPASSEYVKPLELGIAQLIIKAIAVKNGCASTVSSAFYNHMPRPIVMMPESGTYESHVLMTVLAEECPVRFTLDGLVPTASSPLYESPVLISTQGTVTVTAAMFDGASVVGQPVRRRYVISSSKPKPPAISPAPGQYELPLHITMEGSGVTRYTLDGSEPSSASAIYNGPITIAAQGPITVKAVTFSMYNASLRSDASQATYTTILPPTRTEVAFASQNIAFDTTVETQARQKAADVMSWLLAATERKGKLAVQVAAQQRKLDAKEAEQKELQTRLNYLKREIDIKSSQRQQLTEKKRASRNEAKENVELRIAEVKRNAIDCQQQLNAMEMQLQQALALHEKWSGEKKMLEQETQNIRDDLEARYVSSKRSLQACQSSAVEEAAELRNVIAEQRYEMRLLQETLEAAKPPQDRALAVRQDITPFLPPKRIVDLPSVETIVPVPPGMMRLITKVQGNGLQELRQKHLVDACIVQCNVGLGIRIVGHSAGVNRCMDEIARIISGAG